MGDKYKDKHFVRKNKKKNNVKGHTYKKSFSDAPTPSPPPQATTLGSETFHLSQSSSQPILPSKQPNNSTLRAKLILLKF